MALTGCTAVVESRWGPAVDAQCLGGFDFTLLFEDSILTVLPVALFAMATPFRIAHLLKTHSKVNASWLLPTKIVCYLIYLALQASQIAIIAPPASLKTPMSLAACILDLSLYFVFLSLSCLEHTRSLRPSTLLCCLLGLTLLLDMARLRTIWLIYPTRALPSVVLAAYCVKIALLFLESTGKRSLAKRDASHISPEDASGIYERLLFTWINKMLRLGYHHALSVSSLMEIDQDLTTEAPEQEALSQRWARIRNHRKYSLLWTFAWYYRWTVFWGAPPMLAYVALEFAQPFLIQRVLDFIDQPADLPNRQNIAYGLIGAYALVYVGIAVSYAYHEHTTDKLVLKFRASLVTLIFDKGLRLQATHASDASALTLMSADVDRVGNGLRHVHDTWSALVEVGVAIWLLERLLGQAVIGPALFVVFILLVGIPISNTAGNAQGLWLDAIESRIAVTSKALGHLKGIKMIGAVETIRRIIIELRENEVQQSAKYRWYSTLNTTVAYLADALTPAIGFGTYIVLSEARGTQTLTQGVGFAALTLFSLVSTPMSLIVEGIEQLKTVVNCFDRIQEHLLAEEQEDSRLIEDDCASTSSPQLQKSSTENEKLACSEKSQSDFLVALKDVSLGYDSESTVLTDASLTISRGQITMLAGPVGSGKSTLLAAILGEMPHVTGSINTSFRSSAYCPQSPWITHGSVQQNILGTSRWDEKWYGIVTAACALDADFAMLPSGDQTKTGSRGSRLSGGQQKRVALARALYSRLPVLILDDVLTGLDRRTEQSVLDAVFGPSGLIPSRGHSVILATNSANHLPYADHVILLDDGGNISEQGTYGEVVQRSLLLQNLSASQRSEAVAEPTLLPQTFQEAIDEVEQAELEAENEARRTGDLRTYLYYFHAATWPIVSIFFLASCIFVFTTTFPTVWVQWWTEANDEYGTQRVGYWLGIYAMLGALAVLATFGSGYFLLMVLTPITARRLHDRLLTTVCGANLVWLASTDAGTTTNRFSQDLELVDLDLPQVLDTTVLSALSALAEAVLVFAGSGYLAATIPGVIAAVYVLQHFYLRTSRQLRLLDIESRAPLFGVFLELLAGLAAVRAYGWGTHYRKRARDILNDSQKPYYLLFTAQRWLTLVLQLVVAAVAVLLVALATALPASAGSGSATYLLGVALFNIVSFGSSLQQVITDWTQLEQSIGAIARIRGFVSGTPSENAHDEAKEISEDWPERGDVCFQNVSARYEDDGEPILKDVSIPIRDGEKVAICGRTGSGKTSLISALLRMLDTSAGTISIAGTDITTVARTTLRERISTLPQEPFFFCGTVRLNADPQGLSSDQTIIEALKAVRLWSIWEDADGLDAELDESVLSHGQRQLFCLARAMCKPCRILILDEVSSSVDAETEQLMHRLIAERFARQTVIAIAHKLSTIVDFDKVAVLDSGRLVEFGKPSVLLETEQSEFRSLFESSRYVQAAS